MKILSFLALSFLFCQDVFAAVDPLSLAALSLPTVLNKLLDKGEEGGANASGEGSLLEKKPEINLEQITFSVDDDMNNRGAVRLHLVLVYKDNLKEELQKWTSREYFHQAEQLKKDNPDNIKILQWELKAEKQLFDWKKKESESDFKPPKFALVFVEYSGEGIHRATVPVNCKKMKLMLQRDDFKLERVKEKKE